MPTWAFAVPINPVNPNRDELYHILRKRLFEHVAPEPEVQRVAAAYREALREANRMNLTTTSPEAYTRVVDAYPYDPKMREAGQDYVLDVLKACLAGRSKWD